MDGDPAVESELDSFSLILPLPYRVAIILVLGEHRICHWSVWRERERERERQHILTTQTGVWAWASNLQYLALVKIVSILSVACYEKATDFCSRM